MIRRLLLIVVSIAIVLGGSGVAVPAMANVGMEFSAAAKKSVSTRQRRDPGQIALQLVAAIGFRPVATPKPAIIGMESRPASILLSAAIRAAAAKLG